MSCVVNTNNMLILGIPPYFFFVGIGAAVAISYYLLSLAKTNHSVNKNGVILLLSVIGLVIGAVFFGFLTKLAIALYNDIPINENYFSNLGIVFYGGLTGFVVTFICLQKIINKEINIEIINILAVTIPLFHCFARVGCFFAGCCYGKELDTFISINYIPADLNVAAPRIPVQLIEAGANLLIFVFLFILSKKQQKRNLLIWYLSIYAVCRFALEFIRGDAVRGEFGCLSFSQVYSLLIIAGICIFNIIRRVKHNESS